MKAIVGMMLGMFLLTGCDDPIVIVDLIYNNHGTPGDTDTGPLDSDRKSDTEFDTEYDTDFDTDFDTGFDSDTYESPVTIAIDENFDDWDGGGDSFYMIKPLEGSGTYRDNNTRQYIDGHECLAIHEIVEENMSYGYATEFQLMLDQRTDMSNEEFNISFDVYIPEEMFEKSPHIQFGFIEAENFTPIYSLWYTGILQPDEWITIEAPIDTISGDITYSGFPNNPQDWILDAVRIALILDGEEVTEGDEALFYVDNLKVGDFVVI